MSNHRLSEGSLAVIMTGGTVDEPIMQVLGSKKLVGTAAKERFRLLVSDGKYQISFAMIATQINDRITSGELSNNSVIKVKKFITSMINSEGKANRRVMVILDMEILSRGEEVGNRIGNPIPLPDDPSSVLKIESKTNGASSSGTSSVPAAKPALPKPQTKPAAAPFVDSGAMSDQLIMPIMNLSPYQNKWTIKARVTNKSAIRTWSNSRGDGKLFSIDLADESGEIRATAFTTNVDKFYDLIEIDKVYYISKCQIKMANRKFCHLNNDYEMTFTGETTVSPCFDEMSVPKPVYNFVTIDQLASQEVGALIDVIGICKSMNEVQIITIRSTNKDLKKRELTLVDQSKNSITLTLWGNEAENFKEDQSVLAVRGAKVGEFGGGKNLSVVTSSILKVNPDLPEAHRLRGWYDNEGKSAEAVNISARTGASGMKTDWMSIADVKKRKLGGGDTPDYYQCKATILTVNSNNVLYKACPSEDCNKKVIDMENNQYRCEKCNKEYESFKYRMLMAANIGDWTDNQWVSIFAGEAEKILGMTSQELGEATANDEASLATYCSKPNFSEHVFKCRTKMETFNDETRLKTVVMKADPIDFKEYNAYLASSISQMLNL